MFSVLMYWVLNVLSLILMPEATCVQGSNMFSREDISSTHFQTVRRHAFIKDEFHHLNVPRIGSVAVYDVFDCTFECLSNPLCFSVNVVAFKGSDGKFWCELLSSDKFKNFTEYNGNKSSHHYFIKTSCSSSPCQNGGTCLPNYKHDTFECLCERGFIGELCERAATSCKEMYNANKPDVSKLVTLQLNSKPISVLCHFGDFGCGDGGWTPVMKIDGEKQNFHYDSNLWSNKETSNLDGGKTGFDTEETKLPTYWNTSFTKICLGMKIGQQIKFIVINKQANSLYSLIADGQYRATSLGRDMWKTLIGLQASLQYKCNKEGFNAASGIIDLGKARIGILGNEQNNCDSCDSRIGFGTRGRHDDSNTCGNEARYGGDNGDKHLKAMGYILVK